MTTAADIARGLTSCEHDLLMDRCSGWGSWMFTAGHHMASLGLGTVRDGSIAFDTPLAAEVVAILQAEEAGQ